MLSYDLGNSKGIKAGEADRTLAFLLLTEALARGNAW
jgi:hypothetical protein